MSYRKSKRVAEQQENEMYWLMHNFPQGINTTVLTDSLPQKPSPVKAPIKTVNQRLLDQRVMKLPKMLRSGKSIETPKKPSPVTESKLKPGRAVSSKKTIPYRTRSKSYQSALSTRNGVYKRKSRSESSFDHPTEAPKRRKTVEPSSKKDEALDQSKLPKFQVEPNKITTRSGAQYSFSWKLSGSKPNDVVKIEPLSECSQDSSVNIKSEIIDYEDIENDYKLCPNMKNRKVNNGGIVRRGKRKRLSLLPAQKSIPEPFDYTQTWLDVLNKPQTPSSSRSVSPSSNTENIANKRAGRAASLNCRALLAAIIAPETKKVTKKSPPPTSKSSSPVMKKSALKNDVKIGEARSFVKVRISKSFNQKVEFVDNTVCHKINGLPINLHKHETIIISHVNKIRVKTNGWIFQGDFVDCCSFVNKDSTMVTRLYFAEMERNGIVVRVGDSVSLQTAVNDENPFVGKIISMWQDNIGEMMVTMSWFYGASDLENIRKPHYMSELYLSKHTDDNSVACIQEKVHVLSYNDFCRYRAHLAQIQAVSSSQCRFRNSIVPNVVKWRDDRFPAETTPPEIIYFCRSVYDFRLRRTLKQPLYYTQLM